MFVSLCFHFQQCFSQLFHTVLRNPCENICFTLLSWAFNNPTTFLLFGRC